MTLPITICMMVRNEERFLAGALDSFAELGAEAIVVCDTGSTDGTKAITKAHRTKPRWVDCSKRRRPDLFIDDGKGPPMLHFGRARNATICEAHTEWVTIFDADYRLAGHTPRSVATFVRNPKGFAAARFRVHDADSLDATPDDVCCGLRRRTTWTPFVLLRREFARYENPIHEDPSRALGDSLTCLLPRADLAHYGSVPELRTEQGRNTRNDRLLRWWQAQEPSNLTPYHYLIRDAYEAHDIDAVERWLDLASSQRPEQRHLGTFGSLATMGALAAMSAQKPALALARCDIAERCVGGPTPDIAMTRGLALEAIGHNELALKAYAACEEMGLEVWSSLAIAGATTWSVQARKGVALMALGRHREAVKCFDTALSHQGDGLEGQRDWLVKCRAECEGA